MSTFPLKQGSRGSQVAEVQAYLNTVAQLVGSNTRIEPDSKFGQRTEDLLYELFKLKEVTEKSYQVMRKASPEAAKRLSTFKQEGGMSPDAMLNAVLANDRATMKRLLRIYDTWHGATPAHRKRYEAEYAKVFAVAVRMAKRVKLMDQQDKYLLFRYGWDNSDTDLVKKYARMPKDVSVGIAPLVVIAIVAVAGMIVGGVGYAAVRSWLKPAYDESSVDFKITKELEPILAKLTPQEQETLKKEAEKQVDDAYNAGKDDGSWGGMKKVVKYGALTLISLYAYDRFARPRLANHYGRAA